MQVFFNVEVSLRFLSLSCLVVAAALAGARASAGAPAPATQLVNLINDYRAASESCGGHLSAPVSPLAPHPALAAVHIRTGTFIELELERGGYHTEHAIALLITGADDVTAAMDSIRQRYCAVLRGTDISAIGVRQIGRDWQIVVAQPTMPLSLPPSSEAGLAILGAVNIARASARTCGEHTYPPAPALTWSEPLTAAALAHSTDMAAKKYFSHRAPDGSIVGERATRARYIWRVVGENIAGGQTSADEVVAAWLASPGHCSNIMEPRFTDMGRGLRHSHRALSGPGLLDSDLRHATLTTKDTTMPSPVLPTRDWNALYDIFFDNAEHMTEEADRLAAELRDAKSAADVSTAMAKEMNALALAISKRAGTLATSFTDAERLAKEAGEHAALSLMGSMASTADALCKRLGDASVNFDNASNRLKHTRQWTIVYSAIVVTAAALGAAGMHWLDRRDHAADNSVYLQAQGQLYERMLKNASKKEKPVLEKLEERERAKLGSAPADH